MSVIRNKELSSKKIYEKKKLSQVALTQALMYLLELLGLKAKKKIRLQDKKYQPVLIS